MQKDCSLTLFIIFPLMHHFLFFFSFMLLRCKVSLKTIMNVQINFNAIDLIQN